GRSGFRLTSEGDRFYAAARRLFLAVERYRSDVAAVEGRLAGDLFIGLQSHLSSDPSFPLHKVLGEFMDVAPGIHLHLESASPGHIVQRVETGALRLGITILPRAAPDLRKRRLYWETA